MRRRHGPRHAAAHSRIPFWTVALVLALAAGEVAAWRMELGPFAPAGAVVASPSPGSPSSSPSPSASPSLSPSPSPTPEPSPEPVNTAFPGITTFR
ncbi:MAG TPA: hypothetical protein VJO36_06280, partial [Actinomycetota bacterium]|nr:hypothetical protein [Actinomycetota bacterium]